MCGSGFIAEATYKVPEKHCRKTNSCNEDWAKGESRSQAGEWIWFLGKGIASSNKQADLNAKGQALYYLTQECSIPHKSIRFVERCEERVGDSYIVYTRASITHQNCNEAKKLASSEAHPELLEILGQYKSRK